MNWSEIAYITVTYLFIGNLFMNLFTNDINNKIRAIRIIQRMGIVFAWPIVAIAMFIILGCMIIREMITDIIK